MMFLISNWKVILAVVATAALAYLLHTVAVDRLEAQQRAALTDQATKLQGQCDADKAITKGVSDDYQKKLDVLNDQLAALRVREPARCIAVSTPVAAAGRHGAAGTGKPAGQNGVTAQTLYDFAGEAERYRLQLISCQSFITETWQEQQDRKQ
jgi:hypothetical protein